MGEKGTYLEVHLQSVCIQDTLTMDFHAVS
jgi:hypothetical protein